MEPSTCYGVNLPIDSSESNWSLTALFAVARWLEHCGLCTGAAIFHPRFPRPSACEVRENHSRVYISFALKKFLFLSHKRSLERNSNFARKSEGLHVVVKLRFLIA